jgi:uncharacterized ferritin-like protein (DUF455 family)
MAEVAKAADVQEFIAGVYEVVLPGLASAYQAYLMRSDHLDDAPTIYRLHHVLLDVRNELDAMNDLAGRFLSNEAPSVEQWRDYLRLYLDSIGGFDGLGSKSAPPSDHVCAGREAHQPPREVQRDPRWQPSLYHLPHENKYDVTGRKAWKRFEELDQRVAMQVWSAISHFNEIWAAEVPASAMWDLDNEPWQFYMDLARWSWDETRHSTMGWRALEGWGLDDPELIPSGRAQYNALSGFPPAQRLALLHFYEEALLRSGTKQIELKILESAQDDGSAQDMDYDWADEAIHVNYGYIWLKHLLGEDQAGREELTRLVDEARAIMAKFVDDHQHDPDAALAPYFDRLYDAVAKMLQEIPDDGKTFDWAPVASDTAALEEI